MKKKTDGYSMWLKAAKTWLFKVGFFWKNGLLQKGQISD